MKLNGTIILTLEDFQRQFDFAQFWAKRRNFVRDMHPDKIFYYSPEDIQLYDEICRWIELENSNEISKEYRCRGISALRQYSQHEISDKDFSIGFNSLDYTQEIIYIASGTDRLILPSSKDIESKPSFDERLHKIEITGNHQGETSILIGGKIVATLKAGDCIYVTEIDNKYIRVLPNKGSKGCCHLNLENIPGEFASRLHAIVKGFSIEVENIENVTQFRFINGYYEYTADNHLKYEIL